MVRRFSLPVLLILAASGCASVALHGGPAYDAGTLAVGGIRTGWGWQGEVIGYTRSADNSYGLGGAIESAGYSTGGDADPITFTTIETRFRHDFGPERNRGLYGELGTGVGLAWTPSVDRVAVPLQAEIGYQERNGRARFSFGIRERFLPLVGTGSPPFDAFNSLQLVLGVGWLVSPASLRR